MGLAEKPQGPRPYGIQTSLPRGDRAELKRRMVVAPPRCAKREMRSIRFSSWVMGHKQGRRIMMASDAADHRADFGRQKCNSVAGPAFGRIGPDVLLSLCLLQGQRS